MDKILALLRNAWVQRAITIVILWLPFIVEFSADLVEELL